MTGLLLDSNILIDHFNKVDMATHFLSRHARGARISVITRAEVLVGFDTQTAQPARKLLDRFETLELTASEADLAARLRRENGWKLPDALQAATALHRGLTLATRNTKDFKPQKNPFVLVPYEV